MTAEGLFIALSYIAMPAALAYPIIYGALTPWWRTWVGWALLLKALGVAILLSQISLFHAFGPDYAGRETVRLVGMSLVAAGVWLALVAMLRVLWHGRTRRGVCS